MGLSAGSYPVWSGEVSGAIGESLLRGKRCAKLPSKSDAYRPQASHCFAPGNRLVDIVPQPADMLQAPHRKALEHRRHVVRALFQRLGLPLRLGASVKPLTRYKLIFRHCAAVRDGFKPARKDPARPIPYARNAPSRGVFPGEFSTPFWRSSQGQMPSRACRVSGDRLCFPHVSEGTSHPSTSRTPSIRLVVGNRGTTSFPLLPRTRATRSARRQFHPPSRGS